MNETQPNERGRRVAFHQVHRFHAAMLDPVAKIVAARADTRTVRTKDELREFDPDVIVTAHAADPAYRSLAPRAMVVYTRHGFSTKNAMVRVVTHSDFTCQPSSWMAADVEAKGARPRLGHWITGFPAMDRVFRALRDPAGRELPPLLREAPDLPRTLLYAPTYNEEFSAEPVLGPGWIAHVRRALPQLRIVIKPHPHVAEYQPGWMAAWRDAADADAAVRLADDPHEDIYPYFPYADAMLSDASSAMFYFLAIDKPLLLVANPRRRSAARYYDPHAPEWTWRDMGYDVGSAAGLVEGLREALLQPDVHAERRAFYRERVFGDLTDGRSAERVAAHILALVTPEPGQQAWSDLAWWARRSVAERDIALAAQAAQHPDRQSLIALGRYVIRRAARQLWRGRR
jgi:hypothetical protein